MPRFLHTADWQIGRQYGMFAPEDAVPLAEARFAAVERLARLAVEEQVDAVLVAGDVFDAQTVSARCIRRLFDTLTAFPGPWILIPGNHDAALAESVWSHALRLGVVPPQVHLALQPRAVALPGLRTEVLCAPLTQRHTHGDLTAWFDRHDSAAGWLRIGLAHGAVQGLLAEDIDAPNPIAPDRAERARLDYLALGDWHGCKRIDARTWYSGTPEPDRFKANDAGQALCADIAAPGAEPEVRRLEVGQYRWRQWARSLTVASDLELLLQELAQLQTRDVLDLVLDGTLTVLGHDRLTAALDAAAARARCLRRNLGGLSLSPTTEDIAALQADGYLAVLIAELRDCTGEQAPLEQDALSILTVLLRERRVHEAAR